MGDISKNGCRGDQEAPKWRESARSNKIRNTQEQAEKKTKLKDVVYSSILFLRAWPVTITCFSPLLDRPSGPSRSPENKVQEHECI